MMAWALDTAPKLNPPARNSAHHAGFGGKRHQITDIFLDGNTGNALGIPMPRLTMLFGFNSMAARRAMILRSKAPLRQVTTGVP